MAKTMFSFTLKLIIATILAVQFVHCTRRPLEDWEPSASELELNNVLEYTPRIYYDLASIVQLRKDQLAPHLRFNNSTEIQQLEKNFTLTDALKRTFMVRFYVPLEEKTALHVYDNQDDEKLAFRQDRVDLKACELYLDYMLLKTKSKVTNIDATTDHSLANILNSIGIPNGEFMSGTNVFPGHYLAFEEHKLAVDLMEIEKLAKARGLNFKEIRRREAASETSSSLGARLRNMGRSWLKLNAPNYDYEKRLIDSLSSEVIYTRTRFCYVGIRYPSWPNSTFYKRNMIFRLGTWLPNACDSTKQSFQVIKTKLHELLNPRMSNYYSSFYVDHLYCLPDDDSELTNPSTYISSMLLLSFSIIWFSLLMITTILNKKSSNSYLSKFNLRANLSKLFSDSKNDSTQARPNSKSQQQHSRDDNDDKNDSSVFNFDFLRGLKVASAACVISTHSAMFRLAGASNPNYSSHILRDSWIAPFQHLGIVAVDNFLVITGMLTAYALLKQKAKQLTNLKFWIYVCVLRYLRIMPMFVLVHWFLASGFRFLSSGPFWDYGTSHSAWSYRCTNESWLSILTASTSFKSPSDTCNGVGWYLATDVQFFFLTPLMIIGLKLKPKLAMTSLVLLSSYLIHDHINYYYVRATDAHTLNYAHNPTSKITFITNSATEGYVHPQYRLPIYIIGIMLGYIFYKIEEKLTSSKPTELASKLHDIISPKEASIMKIIVVSQTILLLSAQYISNSLPFPHDADGQSSLNWRFLNSIIESYIHFGHAIAFAILMLLLATNHFKSVNTFLSMRLWLPLTRAALTTVLVHMPILTFRSQNKVSANVLTDYEFVKDCLFWWFESFITAILIHAAFEMPIKGIVDSFMVPSKQKSAKQK